MLPCPVNHLSPALSFPTRNVTALFSARLHSSWSQISSFQSVTEKSHLTLFPSINYPKTPGYPKIPIPKKERKNAHSLPTSHQIRPSLSAIPHLPLLALHLSPQSSARRSRPAGTIRPSLPRTHRGPGRRSPTRRRKSGRSRNRKSFSRKPAETVRKSPYRTARRHHSRLHFATLAQQPMRHAARSPRRASR